MPLSSAMRTLVISPYSSLIYVAGLTIGDPVMRTGNPLSVELGPGKTLLSFSIYYLLITSVNILLIHLTSYDY